MRSLLRRLRRWAIKPKVIPATDAAEIVSEYWGTSRKKARPISWLEHKVILDFVHRRVTGDPNVGTYPWFKNRFFPKPTELCLSLGCGLGQFERDALAMGISKKFHANDISKGAIETARKSAAEAGLTEHIEYRVVNLDEIVLPEATYDAIFAIMSAHHVSNLENLFQQCRRALKPTGLMFLDEYIGPTRFQMPPMVTELINKLLTLLPARYRKSLFANDGSTIDRYAPSPIEVFLQNDPSEAIRSGDIVDTLKRWFDIIEFRPYGGAIQHMLYSGITGNFDENSEIDAALLNTIAMFEETLEKHGVIASDFAAIVARPKA
jgi:2-polyprenyl-3-methyl-5-hydroxy-6-metoxy-1,4-benzoquinol methylase